MKSALVLLVSIATLLLVASCGDDPVSTGNGIYPAPEFQSTVQWMNDDFRSVCGTGHDDLYAVGPVIMHYDGKSWNTVEPPTLSCCGTFRSSMSFPDGSLLVGSARDLFVGKNGSWKYVGDPDWPSSDQLWGNAPDNLYSITYDGLRHFDGVSWSTVDLPVDPRSLRAIAGRSNGDVVISSAWGTLVTYDGAQWSATHIDSTISYYGIAVTESGRTFASDFTRVYEATNGTNQVVLENVIEDVMLCADGETLYAAGRLPNEYSHFIISKYENNTWSNVALEEGSLHTLWAADGSVIATGYNGMVWRGSSTGGGTTEQLYARRNDLTCAATIDGTIYVAGVPALRFENGEWTDLKKESTSRNVVYDIAGRSRNDIYAIGDASIIHYDGSQWTWVNSGTSKYRDTAVWVDGPGNVWVAGDPNEIHRLHGTTWSTEDLPFDGNEVTDMWGTGETVFAVGTGGMAAVRKGGAWRSIPTGIYSTLYSVWGVDEYHVYAPDSYSNTICFYDGHTWQPIVIEEAHGERLREICGNAANDMFVTSGRGLLHYDGRSWQPLERVFSDYYGMQLAGAGADLISLSYNGCVTYRRR
jgi:hypothetical protein